MKKVYYIFPFAFVPMLLLLCDLLTTFEIINISPSIFSLVLIFVGVVVGNLSVSSKKFDYIMTTLMPLSFFCWMFIIGYFTADDLETRFNFRIAFELVSYPWTLSTCSIMLLTTFVASFKPIRILEIIKKDKEQKGLENGVR